MQGNIDWTEQSRLFSPAFSEGRIAFNLLDYGGPDAPVSLLCGPGFGDLSHPTTELVLRAMMSRVKGRHFVDIGTGNGILAAAAAHLDPLSITACEIDPDALELAKTNLAGTGAHVAATLPHLEGPLLIAMNMIQSDQRAVFESNPNLLDINAKWIVSGLLSGQAPLPQGLTPHSSLDSWYCWI